MVSPARSASSEEQQSSIRRLLDPVFVAAQAGLDFISSPLFLRISISAILFVVVSSLLLAISTTAYLIFYYSYIPPISLSLPLHLQYGMHAAYNPPYAVADIPSGTLISQQPYEVTVDLTLPRTPNNLDTGVFMVDVRLLGAFNPLAQPPETLKHLLSNMTSLGGEGHTVLQHSRRPSMLQYRSPLLALARDAILSPLYLLGLKDLDTDRVSVRVWEGATFRRGSSNVPNAVRVEIATGGASTGIAQRHGLINIGSSTHSPESSPTPKQVQVYTASLTFTAQFYGLRYIVYNYRILCFVIFSTAFYVTSIIAMGLVWAWYGLSMSRSDESTAVVKRETRSGGQKIKSEFDEDEMTTSATGARAGAGFSLADSIDPPTELTVADRGRQPQRDEGRGNLESEIAQGETADDEDDEDDLAGVGVGAGSTEGHGDPSDHGKSSGRYSDVPDSGIGTMSEGGIVRRRSGRGSS